MSPARAILGNVPPFDLGGDTEDVLRDWVGASGVDADLNI
jgi:hypothetical protein